MLHEKFVETDTIRPAAPDDRKTMIPELLVIATPCPAIGEYLRRELRGKFPRLKIAITNGAGRHDRGVAAEKTVVIVDALRAVGPDIPDAIESADAGKFVVLRGCGANVAGSGAEHIIELENPTPGELLDVLAAIMAGRSDMIVPLRCSARNGDAVADNAQPSISRREAQVLDCIAGGQRYKQIAARLGISEATVKTYARRLFDKTGIRGRHRLVAARINGR